MKYFLIGTLLLLSVIWMWVGLVPLAKYGVATIVFVGMGIGIMVLSIMLLTEKDDE
jgi:hypothetical protein